MNSFDLIFLLLLLGAFLWGALQGFVRQVFFLASWAVAFFLAEHFSVQLAALLGWVPSKSWRQPIAFGGIFVLSAYAGGVLGKLAAHTLGKLGAGAADRSLGALLGAVQGALALVILAFIGGLMPFAHSDAWRQSILAGWITEHLPASMGRQLLERWQQQTLPTLPGLPALPLSMGVGTGTGL